MLPDLDDDQLEKLGMATIGERVTFQSAVKLLHTRPCRHPWRRSTSPTGLEPEPEPEPELE
jgi:hypothetical protein